MTGIAAIFSQRSDPEISIRKMASAMKYRRADSEQVWQSGPAAMAVSLLHTTAESYESAQPNLSEDGRLAIAMDGFLSNWEELRRELLSRSAVLRNRSDVELVLRAFEIWGEDCIARLEGEFAIVVMDLRAQRIVCARDHQGLRPLYYYHSRDQFLVASDIRTILSALARLPEPNLEYLAEILVVQPHTFDQTGWTGVHRIPPASRLIFDGKNARLTRYYELPQIAKRTFKSDADAVAEYRDILRDSIRRVSRSHHTRSASPRRAAGICEVAIRRLGWRLAGLHR